MRAIFCGNLEYDSRQSDLERLFRRYGRVERVDMKSGFAFVYMEDDRDADDAIRGLDRREFGRKGRRLCVEWTKERGGRRPESSRMISANSRPSKTLFVINFDPYHTKTRDLEKHFDPYGKIFNIRIKRNFAFVQYESQEDATRALDATNMSKLMDQVISVEYATKDDDNRRNGQGPDRTRDRSRSPGRGHDRRRSPSPYRREKASPDYGRGGGRSPSPYRRERVSPDYGRGRSPSSNWRKKPFDGRSPSPYRRERVSPDHGRGPSPSSNRRKKPSEYSRSQILSPPRERPSPFNGRVTSSKERDSLDCRQEASPSAQRERLSPDDYRHGARANSKFEVGDSPRNGAESPLQEIYRSRSSPSREGS